MVLEEESTVFDVLAFLCSLLDKDAERACATQWINPTQEQIEVVVDKYKDFIDIIQKAILNEYRLTIGDVTYINSELKQLMQDKDNKKHDIYRLAIEVEHRLEKYSTWQNSGVLYKIEPLNTNADRTGVFIYPCQHPYWNTEKSERNRERILNSCFRNFVMIRKSDMEPFEFEIYYWNDTGLLKWDDGGWNLPIALTPVMNFAFLETNSHDTDTGTAVCVEGLENGDAVTERVLRVFDELFSKEYSLIVFPEALGRPELIPAIKDRMRRHPEYCTFVLLPTICENGSNTLVVLGPGGVNCLSHGKTTPFILIDKDEMAQREELNYDRKIHLLITEELGLVVFAICAELLDPTFYHAITSVARADTIICPSFSPGINAFKETFLKGMTLKMLQVYVNTCSAKNISRNGTAPKEVAMVQTPYAEKQLPLKTFSRDCTGQCSNTICYFDLNISYKNECFVVEKINKFN